MRPRADVRYGVLLGVSLVAGCAPMLQAPEPGQPPDPATLRAWSASGRMALAAGEEGGSGTFVWKQRDAETRLDLRGPLGAGALQIVLTGDTVAITDGSGESIDAEATRAYLESRLGADLPWDRLRFWFLGVPAPGIPAQLTEAAASPWRTIRQSEWTITYEAFMATPGGSLPQRFTARRDGVRVRVLIDGWDLSAGQPDSAVVTR